MRDDATALFVLATGILLYSCTSSPASTATMTSQPTETVLPTYTATPSAVPQPSSTPAPTFTPKGAFPLPLPQGTPAASWQQILIMPGAIAGEELSSQGYAFTTLASPAAVEQFYIREMQRGGWEYIATGTTATGGLFIVFSGGASVSVLPVGDDAGTVFVMIVTS